MVFLPLSPSVGFEFCSALLIIDRVGSLLLAKVFALPGYRQLQVIYHIKGKHLRLRQGPLHADACPKNITVTLKRSS